MKTEHHTTETAGPTVIEIPSTEDKGKEESGVGFSMLQCVGSRVMMIERGETRWFS